MPNFRAEKNASNPVTSLVVMGFQFRVDNVGWLPFVDSSALILVRTVAPSQMSHAGLEVAWRPLYGHSSRREGHLTRDALDNKHEKVKLIIRVHKLLGVRSSESLDRLMCMLIVIYMLPADNWGDFSGVSLRNRAL